MKTMSYKKVMKIEKMEIKKKNLKTLREEVNMMITIFRAKIQEHS